MDSWSGHTNLRLWFKEYILWRNMIFKVESPKQGRQKPQHPRGFYEIWALFKVILSRKKELHPWDKQHAGGSALDMLRVVVLVNFRWIFTQSWLGSNFFLIATCKSNKHCLTITGIQGVQSIEPPIHWSTSPEMEQKSLERNVHLLIFMYSKRKGFTSKLKWQMNN